MEKARRVAPAAPSFLVQTFPPEGRFAYSEATKPAGAATLAITKLRAIRRLMDRGYRPGKIIGLWNNFRAAAEKNGWATPPEPDRKSVV